MLIQATWMYQRQDDDVKAISLHRTRTTINTQKMLHAQHSFVFVGISLHQSELNQDSHKHFRIYRDSILQKSTHYLPRSNASIQIALLLHDFFT